MAPSELNSEIEKISSTLKELDKNKITGALIGELIRKITPELDLCKVMNTSSRVGVLSRFIERHLSHVLIRSGKQGSDWVYTIIRADQVETDPDLWRTFVSPNSTKMLIMRGSDLALHEVTEQNIEQGENVIRIRNVTDAELEKIQSAFADTLEDSSDGVLKIPESYYDWTIGLRKMGGNHYRNWTEFRLSRLMELFKERLEELEISPVLKTQLCDVMQRSQSVAKTTLVAKKSKTSKNHASNASIKNQNMELEENFRLAIIEAIQNLSISDLREIKLPCGLIFDAILNQNNK